MRIRFIVAASVAAVFISAAVWVWHIWPEFIPVQDGYVLGEFRRSGQRYIIDEGGIKKVGQQVLSHQVVGRFIVGTVRRSLGDPEVQGFRLDLDSGNVEYLPGSHASGISTP